MSSAAAPAAGRTDRFRRTLVDRPELALVAVIAALVVANTAISSGFWSLDQLRNTLLTAAPLAILAGGQMLCMLTGGIDLSVTATATATAYFCGHYAPDGAAKAILVGLLVGLAIGAANGVGIAIFRVQPLIMTLGTLTIVFAVLTIGVTTFLTGTTEMPSVVTELGGGTLVGYVPTDLVVWVVVAAFLILGLRYTGLGRTIYAVGDNPRAVRLAGVRSWQVLMAVYVVCAILAAVAGLLYAGQTGSADLELAKPYLLPSVAAAVIGGTSIFGGIGGYAGTILGALILTLLDTMMTLLNTSDAVRTMIYGGIVLALAVLYATATGAER